MQNILPQQDVLLKELQANDPELIIEWDEAKGVVSLLRGILTQPSDTPPENTVQSFLAKFGELFTSSDFRNTLIQLRSRPDDLAWTHLEYQQVYYRDEHPNEPLEVYNSKLVAHVTKEGALIEVQSSCWREISLKIEKILTIEQLREILTKTINNSLGFDELRRQMQEQQEENFPIMQEPTGNLSMGWWI